MTGIVRRQLLLGVPSQLGEVTNRETSGPSSSAEVTRPRWPSSKTCKEAWGSSARMIRAFTSGMIGSSFPARIEGRLADERQGREARPADTGEELEEVADTGSEAFLLVQHVPHLVGSLTHPAAVQLGGDRPGVVGVAVPARGDHLGQHQWVGRDHQGSGGRAHEHQPPAPTWVLEGQHAARGRRPKRCRGRRTGRSRAGRGSARRGMPAVQGCTAPWVPGNHPPRVRRTSPPRSCASTLSTKGCSRSRLAPMPLQSTSGGPGPVPGRTATRTSCAERADQMEPGHLS